MRRLLFGAALVVVLAPALTRAQSHPLEKRVTLSAENQQARNRLLSIDALATPFDSASAVARLIAACNGACPLHPLGAVAGEIPALDVWDQVLESLTKLGDDVGESLVLLPGSHTPSSSQIAPPSVQVRRLVHQRIARLPPSMLKRYRDSVDGRAKKLWEEGQAQRAAQPLRKLVDSYFCSRYGDRALDLLGDLAFEEGDFQGALAWWRQVAVPLAERIAPDTLTIPDPRIEMVRVHAKQILATAFLQQASAARRQLALFRERYPGARGALAGADGLYADVLAASLGRLTQFGPATNFEPWSTFAGNSARNGALAVCPPARLWLDGPTWRVRLPAREPGKVEALPRSNPVTKLCFHPVIADDHVVIADVRSVVGYDLYTGKEQFRYSLSGPPRLVASGDRHSLTVWNKQVFARLGRQHLGPKFTGDAEEAASYLVCLDLAASNTGKLRWKIAAQRPDKSPAFFEGAPLVQDGRVYCAISWLVGVQTHTALACYDARDGQRRWWQDVCAAPEFEEPAIIRLGGRGFDTPIAEGRRRQHLVTLGGNRLFYCSHAGAVVALDAATGSSLWGIRYASRGPKTAEGTPSPRELAPCVVANGRLYVAPLDSDKLWCFDAASGAVLWQCDGVEVVHLLGVTRGRVYFTTTRGLECVAADTGARGSAFQTSGGPWVQPAEGRLPGLGRGLLAGSWLLWPTQDPKLPFRGVTLEDGAQERLMVDPGAPSEPEYLEPTMLLTLIPGNMAFGEDCLAIAGEEELVVYVPQKHFLKEREQALQSEVTPLRLYKLAKAQLDAGLNESALKSLRQLQTSAAAKNPEQAADWTGLAIAQAESAGLATRSRAEEKKSRAALPLRERMEKPGQLELPLQLVGAVTESAPDERPIWVGDFGDVTLTATLDALRATINDGGDAQDLWDQKMPLRPSRSWTFETRVPRRLANPFVPRSFVLNGRLLYFLVDERLLEAVDISTGNYVWQFWAPGGEIRPIEAGGRFNPHYFVGDHHLLIQTTSGNCLTIDSQSGKLQRSDAWPTRWPSAPIALGDHGIALPKENGQIVLLDPATGAVRWTYRPAGHTALTGAPPRLLGDKDSLLALVPRNLGPELVRLNAANGTARWRVSLLSEFFDPAAAAWDDVAVYFVCTSELHARALATGQLLWKSKLPEGYTGWQVKRAGAVVLVYPQQTGKAPQQRAALIVDPKDGQWLERLPLPDGPGPVVVQVTGNQLTARAGGHSAVFRTLTPTAAR